MPSAPTSVVGIQTSFNVVETAVNYTTQQNDAVVVCTAPVTITLNSNPLIGTNVRVVADSGTSTVLGANLQGIAAVTLLQGQLADFSYSNASGLYSYLAPPVIAIPAYAVGYSLANATFNDTTTGLVTAIATQSIVANRTGKFKIEVAGSMVNNLGSTQTFSLVLSRGALPASGVNIFQQSATGGQVETAAASASIPATAIFYYLTAIPVGTTITFNVSGICGNSAGFAVGLRNVSISIEELWY